MNHLKAKTKGEIDSFQDCLTTRLKKAIVYLQSLKLSHEMQCTSVPICKMSMYLHCSIWSPSANAALPPHPRLQTFYPPSAHFVSSPSAPLRPPHALGCFSTPPASSSPLTPLGFLNGMLRVSVPGALNLYALFRIVPLTLYIYPRI